MNAYEFDDGTPFSTSNPKYDPANAFNNRDPRLRMTIFDTVAVKTPGNFYYGKLAHSSFLIMHYLLNVYLLILPVRITK